MSSLPAIVLGTTIGLATGIGGYTFLYAKGASYMTNDPAACANCHVMNDYYGGWTKSSHRAVAVCNDCHAPADPIGKYTTKAFNGFMHSFAFTTGRFPQEIQITARNHRIAEASCQKCHADVVEQMHGIDTTASAEVSCVRCHGSVGHPQR